jgi:hypothetical protein
MNFVENWSSLSCMGRKYYAMENRIISTVADLNEYNNRLSPL